jgi:LDH2 family malate/lactate/ureidoglycolate dehydrogenase
MSERAPYAALVGWVERVFERCGMARELARLGAETLVRADARGIATHGVIRVRTYSDKLRSGSLNARPDVRFEAVHGVLHCHADRGLGPAVGNLVVDGTVRHAEETGAAIAVVRDIGHLAALGMLALRGAEAGMVCLVMQATPRVMGLPGTRGGAIGNNPFAFASPVPGGPPLVLDIASAAVAGARIARAARAGEPIPADWALDAEGRPTTDAAAAVHGAQQAMAGHKGIGIAMMVECLAGSLSGVRPPTADSPEGVGAPARTGAFVMTINPRLAAIGDGYAAHVAEWVEIYKTATGEGARYPGERAARMEAECRERGIPLAATTRSDLTKLGDEVGLPFDLVE